LHSLGDPLHSKGNALFTAFLLSFAFPFIVRWLVAKDESVWQPSPTANGGGHHCQPAPWLTRIKSTPALASSSSSPAAPKKKWEKGIKMERSQNGIELQIHFTQWDIVGQIGVGTIPFSWFMFALAKGKGQSPNQFSSSQFPGRPQIGKEPAGGNPFENHLSSSLLTPLSPKRDWKMHCPFLTCSPPKSIKISNSQFSLLKQPIIRYTNIGT